MNLQIPKIQNYTISYYKNIHKTLKKNSEMIFIYNDLYVKKMMDMNCFLLNNLYINVNEINYNIYHNIPVDNYIHLQIDNESPLFSHLDELLNILGYNLLEYYINDNVKKLLNTHINEKLNRITLEYINDKDNLFSLHNNILNETNEPIGYIDVSVDVNYGFQKYYKYDF